MRRRGYHGRMKTGALLAAALLLPSVAPAQVVRVAWGGNSRIEAKAADWRELRSAARRATAAIRASARDEGGADLEGVLARLDEAWDLCGRIETREMLHRDALAARLRAQATAGALTADEAARRLDYVDRVARVHMLLLYGNIMPRILDETWVDREQRPIGHRWAGPDWAVAVAQEQVTETLKALIAESGMAPADFELSATTP